MLPGLRTGDLVITRPRRHLRRGDVVVLRHADGGREHRMVKRIAAVGGDEVAMAAGRLSVNGVPWRSGEAARDTGEAPPGAYRQVWTVPPGHAFVTGDNELASTDSRVWDDPFVPLTSIDGVVVSRPRSAPGRPRRSA